MGFKKSRKQKDKEPNPVEEELPVPQKEYALFVNIHYDGFIEYLKDTDDINELTLKEYFKKKTKGYLNWINDQLHNAGSLNKLNALEVFALTFNVTLSDFRKIHNWKNRRKQYEKDWKHFATINGLESKRQFCNDDWFKKYKIRQEQNFEIAKRCLRFQIRRQKIEDLVDSADKSISGQIDNPDFPQKETNQNIATAITEIKSQDLEKIRDTLSLLNGKKDYKKKIINDTDYNRLILYVTELVTTKMVPSNIEPITPEIDKVIDFVRYTFYYLRCQLFKKKHTDLFVDFLICTFPTMYKREEKESIANNFSRPSTKHPYENALLALKKV